MPRKKKEKLSETQKYILNNTDDIIEQHATTLDTNPEYSLLVDPENKYNMSDEQKQFVALYCKTKNLQLVQAMMQIDTEVSNRYFMSYSSQQEIRRINKAMLQRRFQTKMLNLNEIGGYLSSLITDEDVPLADRLSSKDKLQVAGMIIDLNKLKAETIKDTNVIDYKDVEETAKTMSIDAIRTMLSAKKSNKELISKNFEKDKIISQMNVDNILLPEEIDYLKSLSVAELMQMLNSITKS